MLPFIPPSVSGQTDEGKCQPPEEREGRRGEETEEKTGVERARPPCVPVSFSPDCTLSQFYPSLLAPPSDESIHVAFVLGTHEGLCFASISSCHHRFTPAFNGPLPPFLPPTLHTFLHALYSKVWSSTVPSRCSQDQPARQPSLTRNDSESLSQSLMFRAP